MHYYLAVDLGASSGKHLLGQLVNGRIVFEEVHRFKNDFVQTGGSLCWDLDYLFGEIVTGMKKCAEIGKTPSFVGIDSWGVDYVLINDRGGLVGDAVSYRDDRTKYIPEQLYEVISEAELYLRTGIQRYQINTIFQLFAQSLSAPDDLRNAESLLMLPCYFNYLLTGVKTNEHTIASTSGLVNLASGNWDSMIIEKLGLRRGLFCEMKPAGTILGEFTRSIEAEVGFQATVVLTAAHDTASAVLAAPLSESSVYLSSGTWSLMGAELTAPITNEQSRQSNFTNEAGFGGNYRFLRNIMGLWMLRSVRRDLGNRHSYDILSMMAQENDNFPSVIDVSHDRFLAPESMVNEVMAACEDMGLEVPQTAGQICAVIYKSLADYYGKTVKALESIIGKKYDLLNMVGGGTRDKYLNSLTAKACGIRVLTGPTEATSLGNIIAQMIATGEIAGADEARRIIKKSITPEVYMHDE
jgi:rhamnulokinase